MLGKEFFERSSLKVARDLIGCFLCTTRDKYIIVETEAYEGLHDKASHASRGETPRNRVMFGPARVWYVYFTYGMHYMLNIVCGPEGHPSAVLIRGVVAEDGTRLLGPAILTKKLGIDKKFNTKKADQKTGLWIERNTKFKPTRVFKTPRIGIDSAGSIWANKHYRFVLKEFETKKFKNSLHS